MGKLTGRPEKLLSKELILNAYEVCPSTRQAAQYLNVSYNTFSKYAKMHDVWIKGGKNPSNKGIPKAKKSPRKLNLDKLLEGEYNGRRFNIKRLKDRLIRECILEEKCDNCGFDEKRVTDQKSPLSLVFNDDDKYNYKLENLKLLCYNCRFLLVGNITGRQQEYIEDPTTGEIIEKIIMK